MEEPTACCSSCQCTPVIEVPSMSSARCLPTPITAIDPVGVTATAMVTQAASHQLAPLLLTLPTLSSVVQSPIDLQTAAVVPLLPVDLSGMTTGASAPVEFVVDPSFQFQGTFNEKFSKFVVVS